MKKTVIYLALAATAAVMGPVNAAEQKSVSDSIIVIGGLPADGYVSSSVVAFGEPPKPEVKEERRFEVGFLPSIPPPPGGENAETKDQVTQSNDDAEPVKAGATEEMKDVSNSDKTASISSDNAGQNSVDGEVDVENIGLRLE